MAKKKPEEVEFENADTVEIPLPVEVKLEVPELISFSAFFSGTGYPVHNKAGMSAFTDVTHKKTREQWVDIFKKY